MANEAASGQHQSLRSIRTLSIPLQHSTDRQRDGNENDSTSGPTRETAASDGFAHGRSMEFNRTSEPTELDGSKLDHRLGISLVDLLSLVNDEWLNWLILQIHPTATGLVVSAIQTVH